MTTEYKDFPDLEHVRKSIHNFEKQGWPIYRENENIEIFIKKVVDIITSEINIFPNPLLLLKPNKFPFKIFRVRELNDIKNKELITEHSYPPPNLTRFGRCNFPNHPVFYGSNNPFSALLEVVRNNDYKNKQFCISTWNIIQSDKDFAFESFLHSALHPNNSFGILSEIIQKRIQEVFKDLPEAKRLGLIEFLKYIDSAFINDSKYSLSASITHRRIYANHNLCTDILMYPSVQSKMQSVNLAINPNFVENCMQVQRFYILKINSFNIETGLFNVTIQQYGYLDKNTIIWRQAKPNNYKKEFKEDLETFMFNSNKKLYNGP